MFKKQLERKFRRDKIVLIENIFTSDPTKSDLIEILVHSQEGVKYIHTGTYINIYITLSYFKKHMPLHCSVMIFH